MDWRFENAPGVEDASPLADELTGSDIETARLEMLTGLNDPKRGMFDVADAVELFHDPSASLALALLPGSAGHLIPDTVVHPGSEEHAAMFIPTSAGYRFGRWLLATPFEPITTTQAEAEALAAWLVHVAQMGKMQTMITETLISYPDVTGQAVAVVRIWLSETNLSRVSDQELESVAFYLMNGGVLVALLERAFQLALGRGDGGIGDGTNIE